MRRTWWIAAGAVGALALAGGAWAATASGDRKPATATATASTPPPSPHAACTAVTAAYDAWQAADPPGLHSVETMTAEQRETLMDATTRLSTVAIGEDPAAKRLGLAAAEYHETLARINASRVILGKVDAADAEKLAWGVNEIRGAVAGFRAAGRCS